MFEFFSNFGSIDWTAVFKIIGIDIMLGADNAVVIALACAALPLLMRNRAMLWGTAGAIAIRAVALAAAGLLLGITAVKIIAGVYLLYVGYQLLMDHDEETNVESADGILAAIKTIIVADFMMSIDNVMAIAAAAQSVGPHATLYAIAGVIFSIPVIVFAAKYLTVLMDKFPIIIWCGAGLLGWVGAEMIITDTLFTQYVHISTEWAYKAAGFAAVILAVIATRHFSKTNSQI